MTINSIVFDIDGSLVDTKYQYTMPLETLRQIIELGKKRGAEFSLNSNRGIASILKFYEQLGFNGSLIGEGGAYTFNPNTLETKVFAGSEFDRSGLVRSLEFLTSQLEFVNTDEVIKMPEAFAAKYPEGSIVVFLEQSRKYTMTVYPRRVSAGTLSCESTLLTETLSKIKQDLPRYDSSTNAKYDNIMLMPAGLEKGSMLSKLRQPVASFGDEEGDVSMFVKSAFCGCPSNATSATKRKVTELNGFVAERPYTNGAYDFLEEVLK